MQTFVEITLCLFAVIGFLACLRGLSDFLWSIKIAKSLSEYIDQHPPKPVSVVLHIPKELSENNEDLSYVTCYVHEMLSRAPLSDILFSFDIHVD